MQIYADKSWWEYTLQYPKASHTPMLSFNHIPAKTLCVTTLVPSKTINGCRLSGGRSMVQ